VGRCSEGNGMRLITVKSEEVMQTCLKVRLRPLKMGETTLSLSLIRTRIQRGICGIQVKRFHLNVTVSVTNRARMMSLVFHGLPWAVEVHYVHVGCAQPTGSPLFYVTLPHGEDQGHIITSPACIVSGEDSTLVNKQLLPYQRKSDVTYIPHEVQISFLYF
jgi:hypothetical protein